VRASSGTSTSRENRHPFRRKHALFMRNGQIGGYERVRRKIENAIAGDVYRHRSETTDTEAFFLLAIGNGLLDDAPAAFARSIAAVRAVTAAHGIEEPPRMTAALADGERLFALRYASDDAPPGLFFAEGQEVDVRGDPVGFTPGRGSVPVLSEPLDMHEGPWREMPAGHALENRGGVARVTRLP
jgi:glutamine amidotransferase